MQNTNNRSIMLLYCFINLIVYIRFIVFKESELKMENHELQRSMSNRHIQLIAIGGAIGTGLFLGLVRVFH